MFQLGLLDVFDDTTARLERQKQLLEDHKKIIRETMDIRGSLEAARARSFGKDFEADRIEERHRFGKTFSPEQAKMDELINQRDLIIEKVRINKDALPGFKPGEFFGMDLEKVQVKLRDINRQIEDQAKKLRALRDENKFNVEQIANKELAAKPSDIYGQGRALGELLGVDASKTVADALRSAAGAAGGVKEGVRSFTDSAISSVTDFLKGMGEQVKLNTQEAMAKMAGDKLKSATMSALEIIAGAGDKEAQKELSRERVLSEHDTAREGLLEILRDPATAKEQQDAINDQLNELDKARAKRLYDLDNPASPMSQHRGVEAVDATMLTGLRGRGPDKADPVAKNTANIAKKSDDQLKTLSDIRDDIRQIREKTGTTQIVNIGYA